MKNKTFHKRKILVVFAGAFAMIFVLIGRLTYLMVFDAEYYQKKAEDLHERERDIKAARGEILDRNGKVLATNRTVCTISVIHSQIREAETVIDNLSELLEMNSSEVRKRVEKISSIERIKSNVDKKTGHKIRNLGMAGVKVDEDFKRFYPYDALASKVLGFTGADNQGIIGLEVKYDKYLKGVDGKILTTTDARGIELDGVAEDRKEPVAGNTLKISLDYNMQKYAMQMAEKVRQEKQAEKTAILLMNPQNGEIYAMVNVPEFNLNRPFELNTEELSILEVKEGDTLKLGRHTLHFVMAPMVHWPEVMVEYDEADKILFSADGFGRFGALSQGCTYDAAGKAQDVLEQEWTGEARRYFINIVGKYGANVQGLLKKAAVLDIEKIAPLHGPVLTGGLEYFLDKYAKWSSYQPEEKGVVVAYSSIHGNTKHAAEHFASILKEQGEENVAVFDLARADMAQAVADSFRYDALVLAGITYDGGLMPCMEDFLYHLKMKNFQNRYAAVIENGSWGPVSGRLMKSYLENMKNITICEDMVTIRSVMKKADGQALEKLAEKVIKRS